MKRALVGGFVVALALVACSGSTTSTSSGTTGTSGTSGTSGASGGTSSGSFPAGGTLSGTWDVVVSSGTHEDTATVTISDKTFLFDVSGFHLNIDLSNAAPDLTYVYTSYKTFTGPLTTTHTAGALSLGALPLALGGAWTFAGQSQERCNGEAHPDSVSINCTSIGSPLESLRGSGGAAGVTTAQRRSVHASIFGDFGGAWTLVTPSATCDVTFQDNLFSATCSQNNSQGTVNLTFTDGLASGKTSGGAELSAKRR